MGKVLFINGSPHEKGCTWRALREMEDTLHSYDIETEWIWLGTGPVQDCIGCGGCGPVEATGRCRFNDDEVNVLLDKLDEIDAIVAGSPVYYGGPSGRLCSFLDRVCYAAGPALFGKLAASVLSCRRGGASGAFMRLNQFFLNASMHIVGSDYWNQVHGLVPEDVEKDEEGLQTMRMLAQNMAWLIQNKEAGEAAGVKFPEYEERLYTHFIR